MDSPVSHNPDTSVLVLSGRQDWYIRQYGLDGFSNPVNLSGPSCSVPVLLFAPCSFLLMFPVALEVFWMDFGKIFHELHALADLRERNMLRALNMLLDSLQETSTVARTRYCRAKDNIFLLTQRIRA